MRSRQTQEGRPHRGHAQTAHHSQCHDQGPEALDRRPFSLAGDLTSNTVALGGKWHKTRRLDPTRVGRHWLVLAVATLLAVAYGTRREEAEARHLAPGRLRRPPAGWTPAQQAALPPRRHSLLQQGVALLRHLNLPAPSARDPHRTPPSLSPHPGRLDPPHSAARHTGPAAPTRGLTALTLPVTVAPAMPGPATRGAGPPIQMPLPIPTQEIPLSSHPDGP